MYSILQMFSLFLLRSGLHDVHVDAGDQDPSEVPGISATRTSSPAGRVINLVNDDQSEQATDDDGHISVSGAETNQEAEIDRSDKDVDSADPEDAGADDDDGNPKSPVSLEYSPSIAPTDDLVATADDNGTHVDVLPTPKSEAPSIMHDDFPEPHQAPTQPNKSDAISQHPVKKRKTASPTPALEPASSSAGVLRQRLHRSPEELLRPLSPPGCVISLNANDHRWVSTWRKDITSEFWLDELSQRTFSRVFTRDDWKDKLTLVHEHAWQKWQLAQESCPALRLEAGSVAQSPGEIDESVLEELDSKVRDLPERKPYGRRR